MGTTRSRRPKGGGAVFQRSDGRWVGQVDLGYGPTGKRLRKLIYAKTKTEAEKRVRKLAAQKDDGTISTSRQQSVGAYLNSWLEESARPSIRPLTFARYQRTVRVHLIPALGRIPLDRLTGQEVQKLLNEKSRAGLTPPTVASIRAVLRSALAQAMDWNLIQRNAAAQAKPPHIPPRDGDYLKPDQAKALLAAAQAEPRMEALVMVALALGLREGEALGLRYKDVDLEAGRLTVNHALQRHGGKGLVLVEPKSKRSRRTIALPALVLDSLRRHKVRQTKERLEIGEEWKGPEPNDPACFVFATIIGTPIEASNLRRSFAKLLRRAQLPQIRFYDLRHSCASLLLAMGIPARVVMETLGHSTINLTLNTYSHVSVELQAEAAAAMDSVLGGGA